jgi:hypothetical protein
MGKPFTTDVMRDTLKSVERKSENNRYSSLGNLMPAVAWPVTITGLYETTGVTAWEIFRIKISSGGIVDLTDTKSSRIKFYPTLSYPANVNNTEGGTEVPTSFAIYMAGATPTRSSLTIYPVDSFAYGDMYTKDVVFTFAHDSGLAAGTVTCTADSNSSELLPNSNLVYYAWTITYATGVTVEDLRTYLTSGTPTLFATYFACVAYHETPGSPAVLPQATTKTIFFMQQGLTVTMDLTCTARLMAGVQYILTAAYDTTLAPHELAIYIKLSYDTDVRDNVTYYSHMEKFPKNSYTTLAATSIVYSWEMSTEESDQQNLIPFMYRENDNTVVFLDSTRFYKNKMTNGSFKPNSDVRTYELGGFSILGADGTLIDINSSGQVGELELINEAGRGFYSLISRVWWYATDAVYTFYRHDSASPRPAFSINRTSGQVIIGGGLDIATTIVIESPYNTHALTTLVPAGETLCTVYATDGTAGLRSTLLFGQNGQTKYSTLMQMTQADSTSDAGLYLVTQLDKLFIGLHSNANADILVTGAGKPYLLITTDSSILHNGVASVGLYGPTGLIPDAIYVSTGDSTYALFDDTNGIILSHTDSYSGTITVHSDEIKIAGALVTTIESSVPERTKLIVAHTLVRAYASDDPTGLYIVSSNHITPQYLVIQSKASTDGTFGHPHGVGFVKTSADQITRQGSVSIFGGQYTGTSGAPFYAPINGEGILVQVTDSAFTVNVATGIYQPETIDIAGTVTPILTVSESMLKFKYAGTDDRTILMTQRILSYLESLFVPYMTIESTRGIAIAAGTPVTGGTDKKACYIMTAPEPETGGGVRSLTLAAQRNEPGSTNFSHSAAIRLDTDGGAGDNLRFDIAFWTTSDTIWNQSASVFNVDSDGNADIKGNLDVNIVNATRYDCGLATGELGSFTTVDGKTVTVMGGIITNIAF